MTQKERNDRRPPFEASRSREPEITYSELIAWHIERAQLADDASERARSALTFQRFARAAQWHRAAVAFLASQNELVRGFRDPSK